MENVKRIAEKIAKKHNLNIDEINPKVIVNSELVNINQYYTQPVSLIFPEIKNELLKIAHSDFIEDFILNLRKITIDETCELESLVSATFDNNKATFYLKK